MSSGTTESPERLGSVLASVTTRPPQPRTIASEESEQVRRLDIAWQDFWRTCGKRYMGCRIENFQRADAGSLERKVQDRVLHAIGTFATNIEANIKAGRNVLLYGPPGTGKDHLLIGLVHRAIGAFVSPGKEFKARWTNGMDMYASVRDSFDSSSRSEESERDSWLKPDVLVLSDPIPPLASLSSFQASFLLRVIDSRYRHLKPTFVSLNVRDGQEASDRMTPQVFDRLKDDALTCFCNWKSFRQPMEL